MKFKLITDTSINIVSSSLYSISLNLVIYPILARRFSAEEYGNILTIISIIFLFWTVIGGSLNNVRLLLNKTLYYDNKKGNYNPIIFFTSILGSLVGIILIYYFTTNSLITNIIIFFSLFLGIIRSYFVVSCRLDLNYYNFLKINILVSSIYIFCIFFLKNKMLWPVFLLLGEFITLIYTIKNGNLIREPFILTEKFYIVITTYFNLMMSSFLINVTAYLDRFLINPILGPINVATFSVASFWGKLLIPFFSPFASVVLSYLCQKNFFLSINRLIILIIIGILPCLLLEIIGIWLAPIITGLLFPNLVENSLPFIVIASSGYIIKSYGNYLITILTSICKSNIILKINFCYFICYLCILINCIIYKGLIGFCIGICIIDFIRIISILILCFFFVTKKNDYP